MTGLSAIRSAYPIPQADPQRGCPGFLPDPTLEQASDELADLFDGERFLDEILRPCFMAVTALVTVPNAVITMAGA